MEWHFTEADGSKTNVPLERWIWEAQYSDGTWLRQYGEDGVFHRIGEVDQDRLVLFVVHKADDVEKAIVLPWHPGTKVIYKYRNVKPYYMDHFVKCYLVGWKHEGAHAFMIVLPNDKVIASPVDDVDLVKLGIKE